MEAERSYEAEEERKKRSYKKFLLILGGNYMNKERRKRIQEAIIKIESLVQNILDEEQEAFDNMIRSDMQEESEEAQESLEAAIEALEEAISCLEEV